MEKPNLFSFATSELSQDAFICWLLSWAQPNYSNNDRELTSTATLFLQRLFFKVSVPFPTDLETLQIIPQRKVTYDDKKSKKKLKKYIDIFCIVNDQYHIIIEDKTGTSDHSNQLEIYKSEIENEFDCKTKSIIPIYLKTEEQSSYETVIKHKYQRFLRHDILMVLDTYTGNNDILVDYRENLRRIDKQVKTFKHTPFEKWKNLIKDSESSKSKLLGVRKRIWGGFFGELQKHYPHGHWKYVNNPKQGFMGFYWYSKDFVGGKLYLELKEEYIRLKIRVDDVSQRTKLRTKFHKFLKENVDKTSPEFVKPDSFGKGHHMVLRVESLPYIKDPSKPVNIGDVLKQLEAAEKYLDKVCRVVLSKL